MFQCVNEATELITIIKCFLEYYCISNCLHCFLKSLFSKMILNFRYKIQKRSSIELLCFQL